jgi:hypothetical protein
LNETASTHKPPGPKFGWRECLTLCLPALVLGAILRIWFLAAIPEGFYGADSPSYFQAVDRLWNEHRLSFSDRRRWLYPILLCPLPALPFSPARVVPLAQHLLGLVTLFGIGWIVGNMTRLRVLWVPVVTLFAALLPQTLWDEHEVISESLFLALFVLTVALAAPPGSLRNKRRLFWFLLAAAGVAATKPHGRAIWLGSVVAAGLLTGNPFRWDRRCWGALAAAALVILTTGEKRQGSWLLLNSALPLVDLDAPKMKVYRDALRPAVLRSRADLDQYAWLQKDYKKPLEDKDPTQIGPVWAALTLREKEFNSVAKSFARGAILAHPFLFAKLTLTKIAIAFAHSHDLEENFDPPDFWRNQQIEYDQQSAKYAPQLRLYFGMDKPAYENLAASGRLRANSITPVVRAFAKNIPWAEEHKDPATGKYWLSIGWLGVVAIPAFLCCLGPAHFRRTSLLWLPAIIYIGVVYSIGDRKGEYLQPVEWAGLVLIAIGLDVAIHAGYSLGKRPPPPLPQQT